MKRDRLFLLVVPVMALIIAVLLLIVFDQWAWGGYVKPSLNPPYVPTAEYLLAHPVPLPEFILIDPPPSSSIKVGQQIRVGLIVKPPILPGEEAGYATWSYIFVNHQRLSRNDLGIEYIGGLSSDVPGNITEALWFSFVP
ncbi:MAG TPA: hypothetical protein VHO69_03610 [Phototrophicaceae bacterium]|nr:hypothetical protein [Phototrophicaceae bacterium]